MITASAAPTGAPTAFYWERLVQEKNKTYQAGLLDAPELWLWEALVSPTARTYPFTVDRLAATSAPARLTVWLQGGSDFPADPDHHVRLSVNGTSVGEASWDGAAPRAIEAAITPGLLLEGAKHCRSRTWGYRGLLHGLPTGSRSSIPDNRGHGLVLAELLESGVVEVPAGADAVLLDTTLAAPRNDRRGVRQLAGPMEADHHSPSLAPRR
jgi:hypothetical protein